MIPQNIHYEVWIDHESTELTMLPVSNISPEARKQFHENAWHLLHNIYAANWEEAMSIYHLRMGWEPYVPVGNAEECPQKCGGLYYPEGSGQCPYCGEPEVGIL